MEKGHKQTTAWIACQTVNFVLNIKIESFLVSIRLYLITMKINCDAKFLLKEYKNNTLSHSKNDPITAVNMCTSSSVGVFSRPNDSVNWHRILYAKYFKNEY